MKNVGLIFLLLICSAVRSMAVEIDTTQIKSKPVFGKEARVISYLLDNNHYRKIRFNDSLSSIVFDAFTETSLLKEAFDSDI